MNPYLELWRYWRLGARVFARDDFRLHYEGRQRLAGYLGRPVTGLRLLDVGCGQHYPETLLYSNDGNRATGIDLDVVGVGITPWKYGRIIRRNGWKRAAKTLVRETVFDPRYYSELQRLYGRPLKRNGLDLQTADATKLPYADDTFDLVVSASAFEHINDVEAAVREINRVLRPGGLAHIDIHLFTSLSGGHHLEWTWPERDEKRLSPPWDHLRQNRYPVDYPMNRLREREYRQAFEQHMAILDWVRGRREGERYLTAERRAQLQDYSEDELLTRNVIVIARKR